MLSSANLEATLPQYLERISSLEEEVQVMTAEKASRKVGGGDLAGRGECSCKSGALHTAEDEMEEMKLSMMGREGKGLGGEPRGKAGEG